MAGLLTYTIGGTGIFLIGASESIISTSQTLTHLTNPQPISISSTSSKPNPTHYTTPLIFLLSLLFLSNSLFSITHSLKSNDQTGVVLQLEVISITALFLLYSVLALFKNLEIKNMFCNIPTKVLNMVCLFGFVEEFIMFYVQKKDPDGVENRYYDLLLVPIFVCIVSTLLELRNETSGGAGGAGGAGYSRLGRGVGLVMQGMWFVQMGVSFYSGSITDGCFMREKSRGNFTIRCKGHPEFHRARAIATLQFNVHLALLVCFVAGVYSLVSRRHGVSNEALKYKPLGDEMQRMDGARFTLDSDDDEEQGGGGGGGGKDEGSLVVEKNVDVARETGVNGYGSHH